MVDQYYRKIQDVENNIENAMQISGILLKLKGYDDKLGELSKIGDKENNISTNLGKINTNENNISSNLGKINTNENNISTNLEKINTNENNISINLGKINTNENNISTNLGKINTNENNISSNLGKINTNENNISSNLENLNNIKNNLSNFKINYSIQNLFTYNIDIERDYTLNENNPEFIIFSYNLEDDFKSNSILGISCKILYNYTTYNNIGRLIHIFKLYNENNELIHEYKILKSNSGDNLSAFLNQNDFFMLK